MAGWHGGRVGWARRKGYRGLTRLAVLALSLAARLAGPAARRVLENQALLLRRLLE